MHGAHLTTEEEKRTTAGLARAVDLLCQAAGVADWAAENVVVLLDPIRAASGGRVSKYRWPIECGAEAMRGLSMCVNFPSSVFEEPRRSIHSGSRILYP